MNQTAWVNIPAIYLLISYISATDIYIVLYKSKKNLRLCFIANIILLVAYSLVLFSNPQAKGLSFFIAMSIIFGGMCAALKLCLNISIESALCYGVHVFFLGDFIASLTWQISYFFIEQNSLTDKFLLTIIVMLPLYIICFGAFFLISKKFVYYGPKININRKDLILTLATGGFFYFLSNISYIFKGSPFGSDILSVTYTLRTMTELGGLGILTAYHMYLTERQTMMEIQALDNIRIQQEEHYRAYEASVALINQKYHDLKYQLRFLKEQFSDEEKQKYIEKTERELKSFESHNHTGNEILDTILTAKSLECEKENISLTCVADGSSLEFMDPMDVNILFGNIIDNAMESVKRISDNSNRFIHISISHKKSFLQIYIKNTCCDEVVFRDGLPVTTKEDPRYHGFGVKSIKKIVEDYNGSLLMSQDAGWFEVCILFLV